MRLKNSGKNYESQNFVATLGNISENGKIFPIRMIHWIWKVRLTKINFLLSHMEEVAKRRKISSVAHPWNNLFGDPQSHWASRKLSAVPYKTSPLFPPFRLPQNSASPFHSFAEWVNNTKSDHCRMLLNLKYKPSASIS